MALDFGKLDKVASKKCDVVPVVVQDSRTGAVLIAAYVNEIALAETMKQRLVCLWSTSRNELWVKGATSGDTLDLDEVRINCEQNSLLFLCTPAQGRLPHQRPDDWYLTGLVLLPQGLGRRGRRLCALAHPTGRRRHGPCTNGEAPHGRCVCGGRRCCSCTCHRRCSPAAVAPCTAAASRESFDPAYFVIVDTHTTGV